MHYITNFLDYKYISISNMLALTDPLKIIKGNRTLGSATDHSTALYLLDFKGLFYLIKKNALLLSVTIIMLLLISLLFISKAELRAERKKDIEHKLQIVFLVSSSVALFTWMKAFFDSVF